MRIEAEGQIRYWLTGEFDRDYYRISELNQMAVEEVQKFNAEKTETGAGGAENANAERQYPAIVENVSVSATDTDTVIVRYLFDGWESFTQFNEEDLFYGTVAEAKLQGFSVDTGLVSVKDDSVHSAEEIKNLADRYIVITNVRADIYCPGKVTHVSGGAVLNEDGSVNTTETDGIVYILLK